MSDPLEDRGGSSGEAAGPAGGARRQASDPLEDRGGSSGEAAGPAGGARRKMKGRRVAASVAAAVLFGAACSLPPVDLEEQRPLPLRSTIVAADGSILARLYKQNRAYVPIERIPTSVVEAVLSAEDARFFEHPGFDFRSIARAALANLEEGQVVQGGSTITQQYVKNTYFRHPARTFERKARELRFALELERRLTKRDILERYLNTVYFGEGAYGVKAAAETYFDRHLGHVSVPQAALLAALIRAPTNYDPRIHPRAALVRRNYVLRRMGELGELAPAQVARATGAPLRVAAQPPELATDQPYFVEAVRQEILGDPRLGVAPDERDRLLHEGGLRVETTFSPRLQAAAERAVSSVLDQPGDPEAALVAIRPRTGDIVAMVAGRDFRTSQVNLALGAEGGGSGRQPGSAFKPIVAAAALEAGIPLDRSYGSEPATFTFDDAEPWSVRNAEGTAFGAMPLDEALVYSVNGVYARLGLELGAGSIAEQAEAMGVRSELAPVPSIALGSEEVSVVDMAAAYATLANGGTAVAPSTIDRIKLPGGDELEYGGPESLDAVSPGTAYQLTEVLEQVIERGTGTAADIDRPAAGKTGTTNDYADAWFVGYTPQLVAAVWVGYPEGNIPMTSVHGISVSGGTFPAAIWRNFMLAALDGVPVEPFRTPAGYEWVEIDPVTGLRAASWCPGNMRLVRSDLVPEAVCPAPERPSPSPSPTPTPTPTPTTKDEPEAEPTPESSPTRPAPSPKPSATEG
ncbi:MAG: transglycosylase domain-containing protein [Actinomycetota bacterium]